MDQVTHEQANLLLRLYELRREPRLREARTWFYSKFEASTLGEVTSKYPMGSEESASLRMVISYWDMAAGLSNRGLIDDEMFFENSAEGWIVWEKVKTVIAAQREAMKNPTILVQLENFAKRFEAWRERTAPGSVEVFRQAQVSARRAVARSAN
jgi:hypothetical protein